MVFGAAATGDGPIADGQGDALAVVAVDLRMEGEIRGEAESLCGKNVTVGISEFEGRGGRETVLVNDSELQRCNRKGIEMNQ